MAEPVTLLLLRFVPRAGPKYSNKPVPGRLAFFKKIAFTTDGKVKSVPIFIGVSAVYLYLVNISFSRYFA